MKTILKDIATIQTGLYAKPVPNGSIAYLQVRDFDDEGNLSKNVHPQLKPESVPQNHILKDGDVLFSTRGTKNFATVYYKRDFESVASSSFFVLRIKNERRDIVTPGFLAYTLNNANTQAYLKTKARGTAIVSLNKSEIENVHIFLPDINTQHIILELVYLYNRKKQIIKELERLEEILFQHKLLTTLK